MSNYLKYLYCPKCKSDLIEQDGFLVCKKCGEKYEIRNGIPILVDLNNLPEHLQKQVKYFEREDGGRPEYKLDEWQKSYIRRLEENFQFRNDEILIDAGTGSGYVAVEMAKKGLKVIACDLTLKELIKLKDVIREEHLENNLFLVCCSAENLPFKDKIADYLVSNAVLEHLPKERETIREIGRVCKSKSGLMITVPLKFRYILPFLWLPTHIYDKKIGHLRKYDEKILLDKFEKFGYKIKKTYYSGHFEKALIASLATFGICREKWNRWCEVCDKKKENKQYDASNICVIFERGYEKK